MKLVSAVGVQVIYSPSAFVVEVRRPSSPLPLTVAPQPANNSVTADGPTLATLATTQQQEKGAGLSQGLSRDIAMLLMEEAGRYS